MTSLPIIDLRDPLDIARYAQQLADRKITALLEWSAREAAKLAHIELYDNLWSRRIRMRKAWDEMELPEKWQEMDDTEEFA